MPTQDKKWWSEKAEIIVKQINYTVDFKYQLKALDNFISHIEQETRRRVAEEVLTLNEMVPCTHCPKGGLVGEKEIPCDYCGGNEYHREHACAYNDGECRCDCFEQGLKAAASKIYQGNEKKG